MTVPLAPAEAQDHDHAWRRIDSDRHDRGGQFGVHGHYQCDICGIEYAL